MHKRPGRSPAASGGKPTAQAAWAGAPGAAPLYDRVIGRLYDVALDPRHLEDFLDDWDRLLRPLRALRGAEGGLADAPPETAAEGAEQAQALSAALGPHLQRVIRLLNQSAAAPILPPEEALLRQLARRAAFTVDSDLGLSGVTAAATALLEVRPGDPLTRLPLERAHLALLEDRLRRLLAPHRDAPELAATARGPAPAPSDRCPAEGATPPGSEAPDLLRLRLASGGQLLLAQLARHRPPDGPPFALVATSLLDWPAGLNALLRAAFGLTRAETEILRGLSEARSLRDIAGARGRSVETVRAQIKALMAKTETRSQAELLRLVLSLGPLPTLEESRPPGPDHWVVRSPAELAAARIQDGRHRLAVEEAQVVAAGSGSALRSSAPEDGPGDAKGPALAATAPARQRQAAAPDPDRPLPAPPGRGRRAGGMVRFSHGGGLLPLRPFARLARPGGRQVEYLELGAPEGRPVLWLHGPQGVCRLPARHEAAAQRLDLRLLVPIRAGYGASDPPPEGGPRLEADCADILALLDRLEIPRAPVIALSDELALGAALLRHAPARLTALIAVAPPPLCPGRADLARMGRWHRFLLGTARDLPDLVPYMLSLSNAMARRLGPSGFHRKLYAGSEADRTTAASLDFQCVQAAAREILIGADGALLKAVHDGLIASTRHDLRPDLAALEGGAPVHLLSGAQSLRADPAEALAIERAFPWIDYQRFDQAGELLHLQETPRLLALAARHATPPAPPPGPDAAGGQS